MVSVFWISQTQKSGNTYRTALLYRIAKLRVEFTPFYRAGHRNGCVKFADKFNDEPLNTKNDTERRRSVNLFACQIYYITINIYYFSDLFYCL